MKTYKSILAAAALLGILITPAMAGHGHKYHKINKQIDRQFERIEHGIDNGQLTRKEARKLKKQNRRITHLFDEFLDDGYLSHKERDILKFKLSKASDKIYAFKHNDQYRGKHKRHRSYQNEFAYCDLGSRPNRHKHNTSVRYF